MDPRSSGIRFKRSNKCSVRLGTRSRCHFSKTTLIGGILIILPIYVAILLLLKALSGLLAVVKPITAGIPAAVEFKQLLAILVLVAVCFITGLIVRTGPGLRAKNAFEGAVLSKLPGYTLLRGLAGRIAGRLMNRHSRRPLSRSRRRWFRR